MGDQYSIIVREDNSLEMVPGDYRGINADAVGTCKFHSLHASGKEALAELRKLRALDEAEESER